MEVQGGNLSTIPSKLYFCRVRLPWKATCRQRVFSERLFPGTSHWTFERTLLENDYYKHGKTDYFEIRLCFELTESRTRKLVFPLQVKINRVSTAFKWVWFGGKENIILVAIRVDSFKLLRISLTIGTLAVWWIFVFFRSKSK